MGKKRKTRKVTYHIESRSVDNRVNKMFVGLTVEGLISFLRSTKSNVKEQPIICCGKKYDDLDSLLKHIQQHIERPRAIDRTTIKDSQIKSPETGNATSGYVIDKYRNLDELDRIKKRISELEKQIQKIYKAKGLKPLCDGEKPNRKNKLDYYNIEKECYPIKKQIEDLNREAERISSIRQMQIFTIEWKDVVFYDGYISFSIDGNSFDLNVLNVRESFNLISKVFVKRLGTFNVIVRGNGSVCAENEDVIGQVVSILDLKERLSVENSNVSIKEIKKVSVDKMRCFVPIEKSKYFEWLCENQNSEYHIIPLVEGKTVGKNYYVEDCFLFTFVVKQKVVLVWENENVNRSTIVFKTTVKKVEEASQRIYDFARSEIRCKRRMLQLNDSELKKILGIKFYRVYHNDFESWKIELMKLLR